MITLEDISRVKDRYCIGFRNTVIWPSYDIPDYDVDKMAKRIAMLEFGVAQLFNAMNEEHHMLNTEYDTSSVSVEYVLDLLNRYETKAHEILDSA